MEETACQQIPYPGPNDTGNGALDLQLVAERVDALAAAQILALRTIINKPVRIFRLSANTSNLLANNVYALFAVGAWLPVYDSGTLPPQAGNGFSQVGMGEAPGIYHAGAMIFSQPVGAATANSLRQVFVTANVPSDPTNFPAAFSLKRGIASGYEPVAGAAQPLNVDLEFFTPFPSRGSNINAGTTVQLLFQHQNAASALIVTASSLCWFYRAADVEG